MTNGLVYRFYADLDKPGKLDDKPFLELDMLDLQEHSVTELKRLTKSALNLDEMLTAAVELKYTEGILGILTEQLASPDESFVKLFFNRLCPGKAFAGGVRQQFASFTKRALKQFIREQINTLLDRTTDIPTPPTPPIGEDPPPDLIRQVITTEEELEGYFVVKSILREVINPTRIIPKDVHGYFGIFLDHKRRPVCRLYFNNTNNKRLGLFDYGGEEKQEEKVPIGDLSDIYKYTDRLKATVVHYTEKILVSVNS